MKYFLLYVCIFNESIFFFMHLMIDYGSYIQYDMPAPIPLYYTKFY